MREKVVCVGCHRWTVLFLEEFGRESKAAGRRGIGWAFELGSRQRSKRAELEASWDLAKGLDCQIKLG